MDNDFGFMLNEADTRVKLVDLIAYKRVMYFIHVNKRTFISYKTNTHRMHRGSVS
jgi:hypothetical protein